MGAQCATMMARSQLCPRSYSPDKGVPVAIIGVTIPGPNIFLSKDRAVGYLSHLLYGVPEIP
jgi:hypothetical protein